ncbi:hypothetical protein OFC05_25065, partial [Escherichia coli]|nr:hypothetical protein [Escherichia coli]
EWVHVQLHQQKGMISLSPPTICNSATFIRTALQDYYGVDLTTNVKVGIAYATADSVITVGNPANPKAGDNSDYVPASSDNSITGTQRTAEDNFTGAWISMRPRNVAFNYIVRAA